MTANYLIFLNYLKKRGYFDLLPAYLLLIISSLSPYEFRSSLFKVNESSIENIDSIGFTTIIYGYQSVFFATLSLLTLLINSISFIKQNTLIDGFFVFLNLIYFLYLSAVMFLAYQEIQGGFYIAFFGSIYIVVKSFKIKFFHLKTAES